MDNQKFASFIAEHRDLFITEHNNVFAFSLGKVAVKLEYLDIILRRYRDASKAFIENSNALRATMKPGNHALTEEQQRIMGAGQRVRALVHLDIESFYIFSKILLDSVAHAVEYYFGPTRKLPLDSHDDLTKNFGVLAKAKALEIPEGMLERIPDLKKRISDFRDYEIAHEKSPRTMRATMWNPEGNVRMVSYKLYPKFNDEQRESEDIETLYLEILKYLENIKSLFEANVERTNLKVRTIDSD